MSLSQEIASASAVWIVEHGLDFHTARRKAVEQLGLGGRRGLDLPDALEVEDAVREHLELFEPEEHAHAQQTLLRLARTWMERLAEFDPHLGGAVWRGIASRHSPVLIDVYADDPTAPEIALHNQGVRFETGERPGRGRESLPVIGLEIPCPELQQRVPIEITVWSPQDLRGALQADARGRSWRGPLAAVRTLITGDAQP